MTTRRARVEDTLTFRCSSIRYPLVFLVLFSVRSKVGVVEILLERASEGNGSLRVARMVSSAFSPVPSSSMLMGGVSATYMLQIGHLDQRDALELPGDAEISDHLLRIAHEGLVDLESGSSVWVGHLEVVLCRVEDQE